MTNLSTYAVIRHFLRTCLVGYVLFFNAQSVLAQSLVETSNIDPRLQELVQTVKSRSLMPATENLRAKEDLTHNERYVEAVEELLIASYSRVPSTIIEALEAFEETYTTNGSLSLSQIKPFFTDYAQALDNNLSANDLQVNLSEYAETGNWFENFIALNISVFLHVNVSERQAALQKAQLAMAMIPANIEEDVYAKFAKIQITGTIAQLHNFQGNSALALEASLDYLNLTQDSPNYDDEIDLINNLIYSYSVSRNAEAQLFLSEQLLELERFRSSSIPGLSEVRIANVMNVASRFEEALDYSIQAHNKAENPTIIRHSLIYKAVALAGMGRTPEALGIAKTMNVDFSQEHMLKTEKSTGALYLAFLLAQQEDPAYAVKLFNRQQDVLAQKLLVNNAGDTTAMLATLENTRERQAERDAASQREAELQAITIKRQKNLNRTLIILLILLGGAALAATLFARYRSRMVRELEIKTKEAASAEQLKTDFLGMISHELRTPLNGIIGISDFLANYHEDPDIRTKTGIILNSGNELLTVVESLTDMARLDAGHLELAPFDANLAETLKAAPIVWSEKAKDKGLTFTSFIDPDLTHHNVDGDRLIQCLNILMTNAVSFTDKGRIHVHVTADKTAQSEITGLTAIVADTGQGMSKIVQSRLFTPFMQADTSRKRHHMGTGLSLAIAYALVEMMGGKLSVVSREGRGSEFKFNIPLGVASDVDVDNMLEKLDTLSTQDNEEFAGIADELETVSEVPVLIPEEAPQPEIIDLMNTRGDVAGLHHVDTNIEQIIWEGSPHVLIVDDLASNREALKIILKAEGYVCSVAADGLAALEILDETPFDIVIMDVHMALLDGVETVRRLRRCGKSYANLPVIALTADTASSVNAECMEAGVDLFLTKPIQRAEFLEAVSFVCQMDGDRRLSLSAAV